MSLNIQTATVEELLSLENIGEKRAQAIIQLRDMLNFPISIQLLAYASTIKEEVWQKWISEGRIELEGNNGQLSRAVGSEDLSRELRNTNQKLESCYFEKEDLHHRLNMEQNAKASRGTL